MSQKVPDGQRPNNGKSDPPTSFNAFDDELPPAYDAIDATSPGPSRPPPSPGPRPQNSNSHGGYQGTWSAQGQQQQQQQQYPNQFLQPQAPFRYPPGYFCQQCQNTGFKLHNGHPCGTCERNFGKQGGYVQYAPQGLMPVGGVTYMAGDPRIGGRLCGNCKGYGIRRSLMGLVEEQCYVCRGVGRIL